MAFRKTMVHSLKPCILSPGYTAILLPVWQRERAFQWSVNYSCYRLSVPVGHTLNSSPQTHHHPFCPHCARKLHVMAHSLTHVLRQPCRAQHPVPICSVLTLKTPPCSFLGVAAECLAIIKSHSNHGAARFESVLDFQWLRFGGDGDFWGTGWVTWWNPDTDVIRTHWFGLYDRNASHHNDVEVT